MRARISFLATGHVEQVIEITKEGYTLERLLADLNDNTVQTTVQVGGTIDVTATGEVVGRVVSVDNHLEYDEFIKVE